MKNRISAEQRAQFIAASFSEAQYQGIARDAKTPEIFAFIADNAAALKEKFGAGIDSRVKHFTSVADVEAALAQPAPTPTTTTAHSR